MQAVELCGKVALVAVDHHGAVDIRLISLNPYGTEVSGQRLYLGLEEWRKLNAAVEKLAKQQEE